ncbi:hypothetical protein FQA39_LY06836 [Lamprigera yunnana]|nr:hypothetical protein FQA39_LY06836 [Lamprigera yunnana]
MEEEDYKGIIKTIKGYNGLSKDCLVVVMEAFPKFSKDTLQSIVSNEYQKRMRYLYVKTPETVNKFYNLYTEALERNDEPGIIVRMATDFRICPCLIAKLILQKSFMDDSVSNDNLKISNQVKRLIRDTNLISDPRLAYEVYLCTLYDDLYSPSVEIMRTSIGQEYEIKLQRELARLGLAFRDEEHLRKFGYDKTPDIKLEIPIAINGFIIHWVESKARFGDNEIHKEYVRNQYSSYWNRTYQIFKYVRYKPCVSQLAQSPKKDYLFEISNSNYNLPELPQLLNQKRSDLEESSLKSLDDNPLHDKSIGLHNNPEEPMVSSETEKMIQWRPKRGSIKLPELPEGPPKTEEHTLFEINRFYNEMSLTIRNLKLKRTKFEPVLFPGINGNKEPPQIQLIKKSRKKRNVSALLVSVDELDTLISEQSETLEKEKIERKVLQNEMCDMIFNDTEVVAPSMNKSLQHFLELCHFESNNREEKIDAEEFVNEMSNSNRSPEKAKHVSKSIDIEKMDELESNHYQFSMNDMETMKNLDWQLHEILESYKNETSDIHESFECDKDDVLQTADKEGKYWKHEHIRARLESIQKSLDQIAAQDDEDQKELKEIRSNSENNLDN